MKEYHIRQDPNRCIIHRNRPSVENLSHSVKYPQPVCQECLDRFSKLLVECKFCHVPVKSEEDTSAKYERYPHAEECERSIKEIVAEDGNVYSAVGVG